MSIQSEVKDAGGAFPNKALQVRQLRIGDGIPKICVPLVGTTGEELMEEAAEAKKCGMDLVEWRVDRLEGLLDGHTAKDTAGLLRQELGETPILCTCRTEDGGYEIAPQDYLALYEALIGTGCVDLIDVELFAGEKLCKKLVALAHENSVYVVISNHEFGGTPDRETLLSRLIQMKSYGADLPKLAVMPQSPADVLTLLGVTDTFVHERNEGPVITMSMGAMGSLSRVCGELFGSCLTFAAARSTSAPGQLSVQQARGIMDILHN